MKMLELSVKQRLCAVVALLLFGAAVSSIEETKWLVLVLILLVLFPLGFILERSSDLWLFLLGVCSSVRIVKYLAEPSTKYYVSDQFAISTLDCSLVFLAAPMLYNLAVNHRGGWSGASPNIRRAFWVGAAFCLWSLFTGLFAKVPRLAFLESLNYIRLFVIFFLVYLSVENRRSLFACLSGCFAALLVQGILAPIQYVMKTSFDLYEHYYDSTAAGTVIRSGGTLNPTVLSEYIGVMAPLVFCLLFSRLRRKYFLVTSVLFCMSALATVLTFSRGGALSLLFSTIYISVCAARKDPSRKTQVVLFLLLIGVALSVLGYELFDMLLVRAESASNDAMDEAGRLFQYKYALDMITDNPLAGVGLGNYMEALSGYASFIPFPVHNKFLLLAGEVGVVGLGLYIYFWRLVYKELKSRVALEGGLESFLCLGIAGAIIATMLNMQTDIYALGGAPEVSLFIVGGIGAAVSKAAYNP